MKRHIILLMLTSVLINSLKAEHFFFDANGVVTYVSRLKAAGAQLSDLEFIKAFLSYCFERKQNPYATYKHAQMRAYEVMHNYCKNNTDDSLTLCFDGKTQSPALMAQMWRGDFSEESAQLHARLAIELFAKEEKFISYNEYVLITKIIYLIFCSKEIVNFIYTYDDIVNFIEEIAQEIDPETGKNKHEIYILSNMSAEMYEKIKKHMPVKKLFELIPESHWIISSCINKIKPNRAIYEYILEKFNLDAKDCVFVDDQEENVKAADEVGIKSLQCTRDNRKEVIKKLRAYARH